MTASDSTDGLGVVGNYVAGCLAGSAGIIVGFPFDTVKVRLQHQHGRSTTPMGVFTGILKHQGVRGLFQGLTPQLVGGALECGVNYAVYTKSLALLSSPEGSWRLSHPVAVPLAGAVAGVALSVILSPAELLKCRMQAADSRLAFAGPRECLRHLLATEGLRGLTRGFSGTLAREIPGNAIYFTTYDWLKRLYVGPQGAHALKQGDSSLVDRVREVAAAVLCGGLAGTAMWAAVLPADVAKTRMQVALPGTARDLGLLRTLSTLARERRLYMGLTPTLVRAFPTNAAQWLTWELSVALLGRLQHVNDADIHPAP